MLFLFIAILAVVILGCVFRNKLRAPVLALEARLIDDWRSCYKWTSVQLAAGFTLVMVSAAEYPPVILSAIQMWMSVPSEYRALLGPMGGVAVLGLIVLSRIWQQKQKTPVA